jgi:hypothetical protein
MRWLAALGLLLASAPAAAGTPIRIPSVCPIGGEQFSYGGTASYSTWGARPDGKPYGSWTFPFELPECPGNGLIVYKTFDEGELARLRPIIESDRFRALRTGGDSQYYRAYWLMREMGSPPADYLSVLLQATWEAPVGSPLRARYLDELAQGMAGQGGEPADLVGFVMRARWINALRELGRFDEAAVLLARTSLEPLSTLDEGQSRGVREYDQTMGRLIARRDGSAEPFDAIPQSVMAGRCIDHAESLSEDARAYCATEAMRGEIEYRARMRALLEPRRN